ncbi:MAG TPA: ARMT1-like domain-containing protein [bacterium]|nr:ARMT1-like domain-containing protein [bacterium]HQH80695.1 ARMT1-like domain-containing protein [bacterium]
MRTEPECILCLFSQLNRICKYSAMPRSDSIELFRILAAMIKDLDLESTPPELSVQVIDMVKKKFAGIHDPFKLVKKMENERASEMLPKCRAMIKKSKSPLEMAVRFATVSNVIDYGLPVMLDLKNAITKLAMKKFGRLDIDLLKKRLSRAKKVLIIGDNTGEIYFDRLMLEFLPQNVDYIYAVRSAPILNDSLLEDAVEAGIGEFAEIMESGSTIPGTLIKSCSKEFRSACKNADIIISKGQGNFETMIDEKLPIFFLFAVKCDVVAHNLKVDKGTMLAMASPNYAWGKPAKNRAGQGKSRAKKDR